MDSYFYVYWAYGLSLLLFVTFITKITWDSVRYRSLLFSLQVEIKNEASKK